jgi:fructose-bisphosphate aldolase class II
VRYWTARRPNEFVHVVAAKYPGNVVLHTGHCPENKLDRFVRPLIALSPEGVDHGENPRASRTWGTARPPSWGCPVVPSH